MKAKLYSNSSGIRNRVDALNEHFEVASGESFERADRQILEGHADTGKYVLYVYETGWAKSDHLVPGPLVEIDDAWTFADYPSIT